MNKKNITLGEHYALKENRQPKQDKPCIRVKVVEFDRPGNGRGTDTWVKVRHEDGGEQDVPTGRLYTTWPSYLVELEKRREQREIEDLGRQALAGYRRELENATRAAGYDLLSDVRFPEGVSRVSVSYEVWSKIVER